MRNCVNTDLIICTVKGMSIIAFELLDCFECLGWDSSWDCLPITSHKDHAFSLLEDAAATCYNCTVTQSRMKC